MLFAAGTIHSVGYASVTNIRSLAIYASTIGIAAAGQGLCILTGGIDLSIPWTMTGAAVLTGQLSHGESSRLPQVLLLVAGLAIAVGIVNGAGIAYGGAPPIILTLGTNAGLESLVV